MTEPTSSLRGALLLACVLACTAASAQTAPRPSAAASAAERAQKETDRTMYWIRVLADKPSPTKAAAAAVASPAPAPRPVAAVARPAPEPREKLRLAAATTPDVPGVAPDPSALSSGNADNVAAAVAATAALVAPSVTMPVLDIAAPPPPEEADPGLVKVKTVDPDFPTGVVRRLHKGHVEVRFEVEPGGTVVDAAVVDSSHAGLNNAAVQAIRQWRFKPAPRSHVALVNLVFDIDAEN